MRTTTIRTFVALGAFGVAALCAGLSPTPTPASTWGPPGLCSSFYTADDADKIEAALKDVKPEALVAELVKELDRRPDHATSRMELLRKAVFCAEVKADRLEKIALRLTARAALADDASRPAALFDAGYFIGICGVLADGDLRNTAAESGIAGYALLARALKLKDDPEMHVGVCFLAFPPLHDGPNYTACEKLSDQHKTAALTGKPGDRILKNLAMIFTEKELQSDAPRAQTR